MNVTLLFLITRFFLLILIEDDYQVFIKQKWLFTYYETLLAQIINLPLADSAPELKLCFAQALHKGANVYRRIAAEPSLRRALNYHQRALDIRSKQTLHEHAPEVAQSYVDLGATYNELKGADNNRRAIELYTKALALYEHQAVNFLRYKASTLSNLANAWRDLDDAYIPRAINYLEEALEIIAKLPDDHYAQQTRAKIFYNQGINYHRLGDNANNKLATEFLTSAKDLFERSHDEARYAITLSYLGYVYTAMGREYAPQAIDYLQKALSIQKKLHGETDSKVIATFRRLETALEMTALKISHLLE